jgi:GLPGLI family protein
MKKFIMILGILVTIIAATVSFAQTQEGVITYEVRINNHRRLTADQQDRKAMMPEFLILKEQLFFNATESLCKPLIEEDEDEEASAGGMRRRRFVPKTQTYTNQNSEMVVTLMDMMGKQYLIQDSVKVSPWKFGTEVKVIQGYDCKQAFYTDSRRNEVITAWYTDKLRAFLGPDRFNTLPGAILAVDVNNAERVLVATKIELRALKQNEIKEPTSGQKMTQAEFEKMREERRKNGPVIIRN